MEGGPRGRLSTGQGDACAGNRPGTERLNYTDQACSCYPGSWGLTRDVGVLQACRNLPLVHL